MKHRQLVDTLLSAAMHAAPDAKVQASFTRIVNDMRAASESDKEIALTLSGSICDGLRHGNWPFMDTQTPDHAVCDGCGWEGTENDVTVKSGDGMVPDKCPRCGQFNVNYFHRTADDR